MPLVTQSKFTILKATFAALSSPVCLTIWISATVIAVVAGPFGTFTAFTFGERVAYWGLISITSVPLGQFCVAVANMIWDDTQARLRTIVGTPIAILLITADVWLISQMPIWGAGERPGYGILLAFVTLIAFAATITKVLMLAAVPDLSGDDTTATERVVPEPPRLLRRIPVKEGAEVLHLSVQDHFVEVNTCEGTHSLRMRFRDALEELDGVNGYRVHRSHWVAADAITSVEREQSRLYLCLNNGRRVPVSRNYRPLLEEAGLL